MESRSYAFAGSESRSYHSGPETVPGLLFVRPSSDDQRWTIRILHELAHALLRKYRHHTHADVWALTLALAVPRRKFRHLDIATHIPRWARDARRFVGMIVERAA